MFLQQFKVFAVIQRLYNIIIKYYNNRIKKKTMQKKKNK